MSEPLMKNPYGKSMRDSDVARHEFPVATKTLLAEVHAAEACPEQVNQNIFALIRGRKAMNDAKLSLSFAKRMWEGNATVKMRLESLIGEIDAAMARFPLTVK